VNTAQRIVLVVALGIALFAIAGAANLLMDYPSANGWFAYAPNTGVTAQIDDYYIVVDDGVVMRQAGVWLLALATWAGASVWLLRSRPQGGPDE
jgi:hypothetical protein